MADPAAVAVDAAGRTDIEIARRILVGSDVPARRIDDGLSELRVVAVEEFARRCPGDLSDRVVPRMPELLSWLAGRDDVRLSLLTGNLEPIARLKLNRAGIGGFFARGQGAFGSDDEDRVALPAIARARAGRRTAPHPPERTWIIGDTPRDIACARADGCGCLAVTTGPHGPEDLRSADAVAAGATELRSLLERLLG